MNGTKAHSWLDLYTKRSGYGGSDRLFTAWSLKITFSLCTHTSFFVIIMDIPYQICTAQSQFSGKNVEGLERLSLGIFTPCNCSGTKYQGTSNIQGITRMVIRGNLPIGTLARGFPSLCRGLISLSVI